MKVLDDMEISDLSMETVHAYRNRHLALRPNHVWERLTDEAYLEQIGAARRSKRDKRIHPTGAGLLMFGEEYKILYEYPEYFLDYREMLDPSIRWTDRLQSSSGDWTGNLFDFFFRVTSKLVRDLKIPFKLEGITRIDDTPVHKAMREALANCLTNTDFFVPRGVVIRKDAEKVIMENPGYIRTGRKQMLKGGISDPRNKALMKMFNLIGIGERAGSGVPNIYDIWQSQGWEAPVVEEQYSPGRTILTLPFVAGQKGNADANPEISHGTIHKPVNEPVKTGGKKQAVKTGDKKQAVKIGDKSTGSKIETHKSRIRRFLCAHGESKLSDLAQETGLSVSRTRGIIAEMPDVDAIGKNRNRTYRLTGR